MKLNYLFLPVIASFLLFSCGGERPGDDEDYSTDSDATEEEVDMTPVEASYDEILAGDIEEYRTVIFETFVAPLPSTLYLGDGEVSLDFYERRNQTGGRHMRVDILEGSSKNRIEPIPEEYAQSDLKIHADDGSVLSVGDYVRITGTYSEASDDKYQYIDLEKIEKVGFSFDEGVFETAAELTDDFIDDEANDDGYAYVEGTLELSMFMSSYDGMTYPIKITQSNNSFTESVYINIGSGPSSMNILNEGFTDADFIVRDFNGDEHNAAGKKFKLYGTFNQLGTSSKGMFNVEEIVAL